MKKVTLNFLLLCLAISTLLLNCNNEKAHVIVQIPGTYVSLIPAEGFVLAPEIGGFKHSTTVASIIVLETPKTYESVVAEVTHEKMAKQNTTLMRMESVTISGYKGILYKTLRNSQELNFVQWVLILSVHNHALTINGTLLLEDEEDLSEPVKLSILSARVAYSETNDTDVLNFTINADSLKLAKILEGPSVMYTRSGAWNDSSIFDLSFFAGPSSVFDSVDQTKDFAIWQLKEVCADCKVVENGIKPVTIDSLKGFEIVALSKDSISGVIKRLKYEVVLFDNNQYYLLVGTSTKNSTDRIEMFKTISRSFKKKQNQI